VIKIRYADLPGGLHARAETRGKNTIIYLLPGLTVPQRRSALRRLRSNARMGRGPRLSGVGIARAKAADRMRINVRNAAAALRVHPAILAPPLVVTVLAAVAFVLLVPLPVTFNPSQISSPGTVGPSAGAPAQPPGGQPFNHGRSQHITMPPDRPRNTMKRMPGANQHTPAPVRTSSPSPRPAPSRTPKQSPSPSPSQTSSPSPPSSGSSGSSGGTSPSPSPSSGGSGAGSQGNCLLVVLGVCL
jgi:hypothetical protein